jgi:hypothetical protein
MLLPTTLGLGTGSDLPSHNQNTTSLVFLLGQTVGPQENNKEETLIIPAIKMACLARTKHTNPGTDGPRSPRSRAGPATEETPTVRCARLGPPTVVNNNQQFEFPSRGQIGRQQRSGAEPQSIPKSSPPTKQPRISPRSTSRLPFLLAEALGSNGRRGGAVSRRRRPHGLLVDRRRGEPCGGLRQPRPRRGGRPGPGSFAAGGGGVYDSRVRAARRHVRPQDGRLPFRCCSYTFLLGFVVVRLIRIGSC